jgi:hypothetical protein
MFWRFWTGALYFLADLTPAPYPLDREMLAVNDVVRQINVDHIRAHPSEYECFIGLSLDTPEGQAFIATHPLARDIHLAIPADQPVGPATVHVVVADALTEPERHLKSSIGNRQSDGFN